ncbi:hypothetical protein [Streptomyces sp. ms184]|uniref:hypothetical protein n=1 Tax=Streptomyces sp. ms184 TaxID=1827974 RepID=UPI0011812918|nr:hypothetical protein [Streptomyces sp. ms184]
MTRELLVSFAEAVLRAPESPSGVGLVPGTFWAPDVHGQPREGTLADKEWFDTVFPKTSSSRKGNTAEPPKEDDSADDESETGGESGATTEELDEEIPEDALTRMTQLRSDLPSVVESNRDSVTTIAEQLRTLLAHIEAAVRAREEAGAQEEHPDARILYAEELGEIKKQGVKITELLDAATLTVMSL